MLRTRGALRKQQQSQARQREQRVWVPCGCWRGRGPGWVAFSCCFLGVGGRSPGSASLRGASIPRADLRFSSGHHIQIRSLRVSDPLSAAVTWSFRPSLQDLAGKRRILSWDRPQLAPGGGLVSAGRRSWTPIKHLGMELFAEARLSWVSQGSWWPGPWGCGSRTVFCGVHVRASLG